MGDGWRVAAQVHIKGHTGHTIVGRGIRDGKRKLTACQGCAGDINGRHAFINVGIATYGGQGIQREDSAGAGINRDSGAIIDIIQCLETDTLERGRDGGIGQGKEEGLVVIHLFIVSPAFHP